MTTSQAQCMTVKGIIVNSSEHCFVTATDLSVSAFLGGLPRYKNLLEGTSGTSSGLTVE
jgi:hypothetical protein